MVQLQSGEILKTSDNCFHFRFEMPYNIWCGGCNSMIAKGVRFNAEKKQVGNYYSTKVCFSTNTDCSEFSILFELS